MKELFLLSAPVIHGKKFWRTIGFPTANLDIKNNQNQKFWVYAVELIIDTKKYYWVLNLWERPHFNDGGWVSYEVYILDFKKDIYTQHIQVYAYKYLRTQQVFKSESAFIAQYEKDILEVRYFFKD